MEEIKQLESSMHAAHPICNVAPISPARIMLKEYQSLLLHWEPADGLPRSVSFLHGTPVRGLLVMTCDELRVWPYYS